MPSNLPNVVVVVIDTLRADHTGCYGYSLPTTPFLDKVARSSTRFARAYAPAPWTLPSHASLFTGRFPFEHGVHTTRNVGAADRNERGMFKARLDDEFETLAEFFSHRGYQTAAFMSNIGFLHPRFNLAQGFDVYEPRFLTGVLQADRAAYWVKGRNDPRPFFLFLNFMDAHTPYQFKAKPQLPACPSASQSAQIHEELMALQHRGGTLPPQLLAKAVAQYDQGVRAADDGIAKLFWHLELAGLSENTLVVITSDHGQYLGEHGHFGHAGGIHEAVMHIPLLVHRPAKIRNAGSETVDERIVSLVDVPRLILDEIGFSDAADYFPHTIGSHPVIGEDYYSLKTRGLAPKLRRTIWRTSWQERSKIIFVQGGGVQLFDTYLDPNESNDLAAERPTEAESMAAVANAFIRKNRWQKPVQPAPPPDADDRANLRNLGYLDGDSEEDAD